MEMKEYIERETVLSYPIRKDHYDREHGNEHFIFGIESVMEYVENLPAADVALVRHGRWIFDHMTGEWSYYSRCSECGHQEFFANDSVEKRHKYCYYCGALMDGKENNI